MFSISIIEDSDFEQVNLPKSSHEGDKVGYKYTFNNSSDYN